MTLLKKREEHLDALIEELLHRADNLRRAWEGSLADVTDCVRAVARAADDARVTAAKVDDLRDVMLYGPDGGR